VTSVSSFAVLKFSLVDRSDDYHGKVLVLNVKCALLQWPDVNLGPLHVVKLCWMSRLRQSLASWCHG